MKQISNLISFLNENVPEKKLNIILKLLNKDDLVLFNTIQENKYETDIEASKTAFNLRSSSSKYKKIKNNLQDKLFEALLFIEPNIKGAKDEFKNIIDANRSALIANIMYSTGNLQKIIPILEDKVKTSQKVFSHYTTSILSNFLMTHYGYINHNKQKFEYYLNLFHTSLDWYQKESISIIYQTKAESYFSKNRLVDKEKFIPEITDYIAALEPNINKIKSLIYHRNYYTLLMMIHHINKDYEKVIEICDVFLEFISNWPMKSFGLRKSIIRYKIEHLMLIKSYEFASDAIEKLIEEETEGTIGWFRSYRHMILCKINQKELQLAYSILVTIVNNKYYKTYKTGLKYLYGFIHLYLTIIGKMGFINLTQEESYNVKKIIKEFPNSTKDKSAMNIPIIIAQLFEAIIDENESDVLDRIDALKKYSSRYITKNNNTRSNCFINMLIEVVKQNYHPVAIERHTKRYLGKLNSIPQEISSEAAEVEFIPYDYQWELLMTYLKNRKKNIRYK